LKKTIKVEKSFVFGFSFREATPRTEGWRVFCREVEFFWDSARAGARACSCRKNILWWCECSLRNEHDHTDRAGGKKRNETAKNVTARFFPLHCPTMQKSQNFYKKNKSQDASNE